MHPLRVLAALVVLATAGVAQTTAVTGVIEFVGQTPFPCDPAAYSMECSGNLFFLRSDVVDLKPFVGDNVKVTMEPVGFAQCPLFRVLSVDETPPARLELCGTPEGLGCTFRLRSAPGGISQHFLLVSLGPGFVPLGVLKGAFLLSDPFALVASAVVGAAEGAAFDITVPDDPALIGVPFHWQAARRDVGPVGPLQFSNARCFEVVGHVFTCHVPDC